MQVPRLALRATAIGTLPGRVALTILLTGRGFSESTRRIPTWVVLSPRKPDSLRGERPLSFAGLRLPVSTNNERADGMEVTLDRCCGIPAIPGGVSLVWGPHSGSSRLPPFPTDQIMRLTRTHRGGAGRT